MDANHHHRFALPDRSFASITKRDIAKLAEGWGFSEGEIGKVNIVVSELLSNLAKFSANGGEILVKPIGNPIHTFEIVCMDNGPGMSEPARMQEDGVSTFGSSGEGLGAIKRQSSFFDLYSQPNFGTVILVHITKASALSKILQAPARLETGYIMVPKPNETVCGDGFAITVKNSRTEILALDGLGHGTNANEASGQAIAAFHENISLDPANRLRAIHGAIKRTRGAVGFSASISNGTITYCGIGNIAGKLYTPESSLLGAQYKNIISYNGILGHNIPTTLNNQQLEWMRNKILILHSDGLKSRWDIGKYPNLLKHHPTTIAAVLYLDNSRHTDDTLVVVCKAKL
ncbi:SpoIIE family protein phosphatase [Pontibacter cellulosilyticus]|uniref:SpoIIE family protein phosphatase n=1 Tax=Pontibacter cellulosilyticus TaxID=1720253 RepID=A0A923SI78_9BACT|nr:SpoIIE family protein phosphatase [Pontibacter cellulosilyticus]MBC5992468.1 SpoIIE family protein phosphatase [Pontibacter cellulosilyticus]